MHYWCNQSNLPHHPIKNSIRQSLIDQYKQNWHSSLQTSSKGKHYSLFKSEINLEKYFLILNRNQAIQFAKFRTNNNYLPLRQGGGQELKLVKENVNFVIKMILGILFTIYLSVPLSQLSENSISQNTFTIILISLNSNKSCPYQHNNNYKKYLNLSHWSWIDLVHNKIKPTAWEQGVGGGLQLWKFCISCICIIDILVCIIDILVHMLYFHPVLF